MKHIFGIIMLLSIYCCTPPIIGDEEENKSDEKPDLSYKLNWQGEKEKFQVNEQGIRLYDKQKEEGVAYLTLLNCKIYNQHWEFKVNLHYNPSVNNYSRFYLSATNENLVKNQDGYFIQIGGKKDNISLVLERENSLTTLIEGKEILKGKNHSTFYVYTEVDENGNWGLYTKLNNMEEYNCEGVAKNNKLQLSYCSGILCVYTASRWNGISFHKIEIKDGTRYFDPNKKENDEDENKGKEDNTKPIDDKEQKVNAIKDSLFFNEVMYDNDDDGAEYIELYNSSNSDIVLNDLFIGKLYNTGKYISKCYLKEGLKEEVRISSHGYICLTKYPELVKAKHQSNSNRIIKVANFPKLSNEGGNLVLMNKEIGLIDKTRFGNFLHNDGKQHVGCAIEKNRENVKSRNEYWESSKNKTGGTPGDKNSTL